MAATHARTPVLVWVEDHMRMEASSLSHTAYTPLPSIGIQALRSMVRSKVSRLGAFAIAAVTSPTS